jgi:uncharacterized radical SAM protein YgiQ
MIRKEPGVRHAFIGSGIRYDLFLNEQGFTGEDGYTYFRELIRHHISGRLKVAPEHTEPHVLHYMKKPSFRLFERFKTYFHQFNSEENLRLQLVPYFISAHPGCREKDMAALAKKMHAHKMSVEQVQDFTPTPMTHSSVMFHTGKELKSGKELFVAYDNLLKNRQKAYFFKKK